ncbi:MAG: spore protease YyaC [Lachnospiraceae bacterium]|nr:spore protease YyaC [Lachnospiraceae bacterium]
MLMETKRRAADRFAYYHQAGNGFSPQEFGGQLTSFVERVKEEKEKKGVLFLCIGSDRSTGDSLGPLVGYKLEQNLWIPGKLPRKETGPSREENSKKQCGMQLFGTLRKPVHAINLEETMGHIRAEYPNHVVVAIDASIGRHEHVGYITVGMGSLKPGLGVRKNLGAVGDIFITGIVGSGGAWEPLLLQNTRLSVVMELADCIYEGICACDFRAV